MRPDYRLRCLLHNAARPGLYTPRLSSPTGCGVPTGGFWRARGPLPNSVGVAIARVIEAILRNVTVVLTVSASEPAKGISYSLPRLVGARGITATIDPMLSQEESFKLEVLLVSLKITFKP